MRALLALAAGCVLLGGCSVSGSTGGTCTQGIALTVSPTAGTADHTQVSPGDQVQFSALVRPTASPVGCPVPQWVMLAPATWASSDAKDIQISSNSDSTNGLATCVEPTDGAGMVTATYTMGTETASGTATLACK